VTSLRVLRVFVGRAGHGGNALGVFLDGSTIAQDRRQAVAADLGFSETLFVDAVEGDVAEVRIFTPGTELRFAGHPTVGASWLLRTLGRPVDVIRTPAGDVRTWYDRDDDLTWIRARAAWAPPFRFVEFATAGEVEALDPPLLGDPGYMAWAWLDAGMGELRARCFPTEYGILEDEATGAAAVLLGERFGRPLLIRQGVGSELHVRPGPEDTVEVGGRCGFLEEREYAA
jgi:predicted PhzF superfamily epimerase YddE/YHI9